MRALLIVSVANADNKPWTVPGLDEEGVYTSSAKAVTVDFDKSGNLSVAPYTVYHQVTDTSGGFAVPLVPGEASGYYTDITVTSWEMTIELEGEEITSCQGTIDSDNCVFGVWCTDGQMGDCNYNTGQKTLSKAECKALGNPDGCGPGGWWSNTDGKDWIKGCKSHDFKTDGACLVNKKDLDDNNQPQRNCCYTNQAGCCSTNQNKRGAQFCDTIWMKCDDATPVEGNTYTVNAVVSGQATWVPTPKSQTLNFKYKYDGEPQAYVGTYNCTVPKDDTFQPDLCQGNDKTSWNYQPHPLYSYNTYDFDYSNKIIGAYWSEWAAYKRYPWEVNQTNANQDDKVRRRYYVQNTPFHQLTHVLYAFIPVCGHGDKGEGQLSLCAVNNCADSTGSALVTGNPYFNLHARACKYDQDGNEAKSASKDDVHSEFDIVFHDPWSEFHVAGGQYLAMESVKKQYPKLSIIPSIGGWSLSKMFFHLGKPENRTKFVESCKKFLTTWKVFDGIDIDWEFPGGEGQDNGTQVSWYDWDQDAPSALTMFDLKQLGALRLHEKDDKAIITSEGSMETDPATYTTLMKDLRTMLNELGDANNRTYQLSSAISGGLDKIGRMNYGDVQNELDHLFLMTYDFHGAFDRQVGHQTNLYQHEDDKKMESGDGAVRLIKKQGFPVEKMVLGAAMYGRGWQGVTGGTEATFTNDDGNVKTGTNYYGASDDATKPGCAGDTQAGVIDYGSIAKKEKSGECEYFYDECAEAPLLYCASSPSGTNGAANEVYTYDNPRSVAAKAKYVKENKLGGLFAWVLDQDDGSILNTMHEHLGSKLMSGPRTSKESYPPRKCGGATAKPVHTTSKPVHTTAAKPVHTTAAKPVHTTAAKPVHTTAAKPTDGMCCTKQSNIEDHDQCDGKERSLCTNTSCEWAQDCVAVYLDDTPTTPSPVHTTPSPVHTTPSPVHTTHSQKPSPKHTTSSPKHTTSKKTTTSSPKPDDKHKDKPDDMPNWKTCDQVKGSECKQSVWSETRGKNVPYGCMCTETCAEKENKTAAEVYNASYNISGKKVTCDEIFN